MNWLERRKQGRQKMPCLVAVFDRSTKAFLGELVNISLEGLMLRTREPLEIDRAYSLTVELPEPMCHCTRLEVTAKALWCRPGRRPPYHNVGFAMTDLQGEQKCIINMLVQDAVYQRWIS